MTKQSINVTMALLKYSAEEPYDSDDAALDALSYSVPVGGVTGDSGSFPMQKVRGGDYIVRARIGRTEYVIVTSGEYCFVWNIQRGALATNVFINNAIPPDYDHDIDPEYVTEWPYHYRQTEHEFGPDLLSSWKASLKVWEGWEALYSGQVSGSVPSTGPYTTDWATSETVRGEDCGPIQPDDGYAYTYTYASAWVREKYLPTPFGLTNQNYQAATQNRFDDYICDADNEHTTSDTGTEIYVGHPGTRFTALNGSDVIMDIYKTYNYSLETSSWSESTADGHGLGGDTWDGDSTRTETETSVLTDSAGYFEDVELDDESSALEVHQASYYNSNVGSIIQLFVLAEISTVALGVYATSDTNISNVIATDDEETINPSTLEENTDLSDALQALIEASETVTISASFLK